MPIAENPDHDVTAEHPLVKKLRAEMGDPDDLWGPITERRVNAALAEIDRALLQADGGRLMAENPEPSRSPDHAS